MAGIVFSKGSGLNDSVYGASYEPIKMLIEKKAEAFEQRSFIPAFFVEEQSDKFGEKLASMTSMNGFKPVGEGGAFPVDNMQEGYSKFLEHETWKDEFTITREMIDDSNTLNMRAKPTAFTQGYYRTRERFAAALVAGAVGTSITFGGKVFKTTCNDGCAQFSKVHTSKTGAAANQSNLFTNVFSAADLALAEAAMQGFKDDNGYVLDVIPDTIMIPNQGALKAAVFAAIGADKDPATSNNGFNFLFGRWNVIVNPYWTPAVGSPWIVLSGRYNEDNVGAVWFDRMKLTVKAQEDPDTWNMAWKGMARFTAGFNDWRFAAMGGVADGTTLA